MGPKKYWDIISILLLFLVSTQVLGIVGEIFVFNLLQNKKEQVKKYI